MKVVDLMNYLATFEGETDLKDVPVIEGMEEPKKENKKESKRDATGF